MEAMCKSRRNKTRRSLSKKTNVHANTSRYCFAGVIVDNVPVPYAVIMSHCLTIKGQFAQDRSDVIRAINLIEIGNLKLRKSIAQAFSLKDHEMAMKSVGQSSSWEKMIIFYIS
jgi:threonine dehydrogenase-like Zn-dependent dehydrogenase